MPPNPIVLQLDLGERSSEARRFARDNPQLSLADLLRTYPARVPPEAPLPEAYLTLPLQTFVIQPVRVTDPAAPPPVPAAQGSLRGTLDVLWRAEQERPSPATAPADALTDYPEHLSDNEAVRLAYRQELDDIADYLRHGLSVLVVCDKLLTAFIYELVCSQAGRQVVLENAQPPGVRQGLAGQMDQALQGGANNPLTHLPVLLHNLKPMEVLVLRGLELLDSPSTIELLYQHTTRGDKPQLLGFLDPSLEVKKVLTDRFAVRVTLTGLPRYLDAAQQAYTVSRLLTRAERACFGVYDAEELYKNVAGLNAVQFRNAMRYVAAKVAPQSEATAIHRVIRQFKTSASDDIEIPDTEFADIGGYEHVKQQLRRIITLINGPIQGMDERQRHQLIPRGFIFHGPPGTGKTLFAKAIANEMNATIQMISGPEIMDKYVGQSETNLRRIFATARRNAPAVVFFDEFDSIASQRSTYADGGARANNAVVAQLLTELDGFRQGQTVLVIGTTNRIDIIDEALLRPSRLRPIEIGLPDYAARQHVATIHARNFGIEALLCELYALASAHLAAWEASAGSDAERQLPAAFLDTLLAAHAPYRARLAQEAQQASFRRDLSSFFALLGQSQATVSEASEAPTLERLRERLVSMGQRYGLDLTPEAKPEVSLEALERDSMQAELRALFATLQQTPQADARQAATFLNAIMDLIAEYTEQFNNDEIRAIFQEASLEHHMEGQLITPRYLGQKIGLIRKRRDERDAIHLTSQRGRR